MKFEEQISGIDTSSSYGIANSLSSAKVENTSDVNQVPDYSCSVLSSSESTARDASFYELDEATLQTGFGIG